jgi:hypothetical protein
LSDRICIVHVRKDWRPQSVNSKDNNTMANTKRKNRQAMVNKTLHRKLRIEQHDPHWKREHLGSPHSFSGVRVAHIFTFLRCIVLFVFLLYLVCTVLPVSPGCPFLIVSFVFLTFICSGSVINSFSTRHTRLVTFGKIQAVS